MEDVKEKDPLELLEEQSVAQVPVEESAVSENEAESEESEARKERLSRAQRLKLARDRERAARLQAEQRLQQLEKELQELRQQTSQAQKEGVEFYKQTLEQQLQALREQYAQAFAAGDALKAAEIQEKMAEVAAERRLLMRTTPPQPPGGQEAQPTTSRPANAAPQQVADPVVQSLAKDWVERNKDWFFSNDVMNLYARYIDGLLVQNGSNPADPEHWEKLDTVMRQKFPEAFRRKTMPQPVVKAESAIAGNMGSRMKVTVTQEDKEMAARFGIPLEEYMKHKMKVENATRSDGYVNLED